MKYTPEEQAIHRGELVKALRSGEYKQARGKLKYGDRFCCLGVACDISGLGSWEYDYYIFDGQKSDTGLLNPVDQYFGFNFVGRYDLADNQTLASSNDNGATFDQIADIIENNFTVIHTNKEE